MYRITVYGKSNPLLSSSWKYQVTVHSQVGFTSKFHVMQNNELLAMTLKKRITVNFILKGNLIPLTHGDSLVMTFDLETYHIEITAQGVIRNQCLTNTE